MVFGAADAEAVGDVEDRLLAIDLGQLAERLGVDAGQFGHVAPGAGGELPLPAWRLQDVQGKRHAVAHLPRLRHRREDVDGTDCRRQRRVRAVLVEQRPGPIERAGPGVDQRQHRAEGRTGLAVPRGGGGEVEQLAVIVVDGSDLLLTGRSECCELHLGYPLLSFETYVRIKYR
ncbi:hypothetical protein ACVWWO_008788 [Bradyrhizobium sp. F1.13.1]